MTDPNTLAICSALLVLCIFAYGIRGLFKKRRKWGGWYYDVYLKSAWWRKRRLEILERDNYRCVYCGARANQVHHKSYKRLWREPDGDLESVCDSCHGGLSRK